MKVQFKPEVLNELVERVKNNADTDDWVNILHESHNQAYSKHFIVPYFVVDQTNKANYIIQEPRHLHGYCINKKHVIPYIRINFELDDKLFE
jgi:hypothetical protein